MTNANDLSNDLSIELALAHQQLHVAQARVQALEAQHNPAAAHTLGRAADDYSVLDHLLEGCQIIDFDWRYRYLNDSAAHHAQRAKEALLGYTMQECYPGVEKTAMFAMLQRCMAERTMATMSNEFIYPDGSSAWFELKAAPIPAGLMIFSVDITARKQAEAAERESAEIEEMQQFGQAMLDGFPANIAVLAPDGVILTVNQRWKTFAEANGAPVDNYYLGTNYLTVCDRAVGSHADEAAAVAAGIRAVIAGEQDEFSLEYPCCTPQEQWFMLRVTPLAGDAPRRVLATHIDITEPKVIEKAEHEQRLLAEALRDSLAVLTRSTDIETTMQQILAYSAAVIPSEAGTILLHEGNRWRVAYMRGHSAEAEAFFRANPIPLDIGLYPKGGEDQGYYFVADTTVEPGWRTFPVTAWVRSSLAVQIVVRGEPIGLLIVDSAHVGQFQQKDVVHLQTFARYAALALEKAQYVNHLETLVQARTAELQAAKERVEAILHNSADGILLIDTGLRIHQANAAFSHLVGNRPEESTSQTLHNFIAAADLTAITQLIQQVSAEAKAGQIEFRGQRNDGAIFDAELSIGLIKNDGLVCILRNITERKAQERQLRYHASLQRVVGDAVIVTDMTSQIQSWNQGAERIYGWRAAEVLGQPTATVLQTQFAAPEERAYHIAQLRSQGWWQAEATQRHRAGHRLHILSSAALIYDEHGNPSGVVAVNHDITARKLAEEALQKAAAEIFELYNNAPCGYHSLDQDGVIIAINDTELRWLGYERTEVVGQRRLLDLLTPESQLVFHEQFPLFKARGWMQDTQYEFVGKNGATFPVLLSSKAIYDEQGRFLVSHSNVFDITALKQAEQALVESEARYRLLAENVKDVIVKLSPTGVRTFVTPSCMGLLGYTPDELIGRMGIELIHPEDRPTTDAIMQQALHRGKTSFEMTHRVRHKAGHYVWVEDASTIIRAAMTGAPLEIVGILRDITERKRMEMLQQARAEEERAFQQYLRALHEITIELTQIDEIAAFYRYTVELGLAYFKIDRLAIFIFDPTTGLACGAYGTDPRGNVVAEEHVQFTPAPDGLLNAAFVNVERFSFQENVPLFYNHQIVGYGWNAATVLWNGAERLGWLVADNLLTQKTATKPLLDILRLYALAVGTLLVQKQAQAALRESEQRYRLLAENISDVVVETTPAAQFLYVSPSCRTVLGYEPLALVGQNALSYIHPDDLPLAQQAFLATENTNQPTASMSVRFRHQAGHHLWLETIIRAIRTAETGVIEKYIGSARDISDRKTAEVALKGSEEKYRLLVETMRGGLIVSDVADRFTYVNDRVCELFGYPRAELLGKRAYDLVDVNNAEAIKTRFEQRRRLKNSSIELTVTHRNGMPIHILILGSPLLNKNGDYDGSLVVIVDITAQKQAEDILRQALAKEKELSELKSRFVSMASHEFRTPLATILAITETLRAYRQKLSDDQIHQRLGRITEQVDHLKDIMEDVLLLAQMQARRAKFNPIAADLDALCRTVVEEFQSRADIHHRLFYASSPGDYTLLFDPKLMHQILSNLVSNAIKYSPAEKSVQVTLAQSANQCVLSVRDEGIGIPEIDQKHLFEPFHRAGNVGAIAGTGLGLVITKEAIELHNGAITVESQVGHGTTFTIYLPLTEAHADRTNTPPVS